MKPIDFNEKYVVNPAYRFRSDIKSILITNNYNSVFDSTYPLENITTNFIWKIHPDLFYFFSFFDGEKTLTEIRDYFCQEYDIDAQMFLNAIEKFIKNDDIVVTPVYFKIANSIPKNMLVPNNENLIRRNLQTGIDLSMIKSNLDMDYVRLNIPNGMTLMLTTACVTDCIYCYADKPKVTQMLSFNRLKSLLDEADEIGMTSVELDGGDFFLYPYWKQLLSELKKHRQYPQISTKYPITEEIIEELLANDIHKIQLSVDSVNHQEMMKILHVEKSYLDDIKKGVTLLDEAGFEITIKPVITKFNDSVQSMNDTIDYFTKFKNVRKINFTPADYSQFKPLHSFCSNKQQLEKLKQICLKRNEEFGDNKLAFLGFNTPSSIEERTKVFSTRSSCSGNVSSFFVLPDGKVTICEQMYWHPFFIIGDLNRQSIMEMWNSEKALSLWNFSQDEVRDVSPCKKCTEFEQCRRGLGNCWRIAISAYGAENYDFPAPNCPKSLPIDRDDYYIPEF